MYCAKCGEKVAVGKSFCGSCGTPAPVPDDQPTAPTQPVAPTQLTAPPQPVAQVPAAAPPVSWDIPEPPRKHGKLVALAIVLLMLIVAVAVVVVLLLTKDDKAAGTTTSVAPATTVAGTADTSGPGTTTAPGGVVHLVDLTLRAADIEANSVLSAQGSTTYVEANLIDGNPGTCWAEGAPGYGLTEFIHFTWASPVTISQVRIIPGYDKIADGWDRWTSNGRVRSFDLVFSDGSVESFAVTDTRALQTLVFGAPHTVTSVRFIITGAHEASPGPHRAEDTSVSELHFWGTE
jgi:hypothetical protein